MDRSFCPPNFGIIFGINPLIKLLHGKTPHICMHTLWHEHIARATTECSGIAIDRKQHTTWLSQCVPSRVCNSRNLISFLKITDTLLGKERDTLRIYTIMNKHTEKNKEISQILRCWNECQTIDKANISLLFSFCLCNRKSASEGCVCPNSVCHCWPWHCSHEIWCWLSQRRHFLSIPCFHRLPSCISLNDEESEGVKGRKGGRHARKAS